MLIAVAGASGRLGRNLVEKLVKKGYKTLVLLRSKSSSQKIPKGAIQRFVSYESGDISDLKKSLEGVTHLINLTGSTETHLSQKELEMANVDATKKLLAASPSSLKKFIHLSSIAVYGKKFGGIYNEESPRRADNSYAKTKLAGERAALSYKKNFDVVILQPGMIYGSDFRGGFYPILKKIRDGKMKIIGDGKNHIPLVHADDVSIAILSALKAKVQSGSTYLLVNEPQMTQSQLFELAASALKTSPPKKHVSYALIRLLITIKTFFDRLQGKIPSLTLDMAEQIYCDRHFSSKKAVTELKFKPAVSFKMGIEEVVNQFLKENEAGRRSSIPKLGSRAAGHSTQFEDNGR